MGVKYVTNPFINVPPFYKVILLNRVEETEGVTGQHCGGGKEMFVATNTKRSQDGCRKVSE